MKYPRLSEVAVVPHHPRALGVRAKTGKNGDSSFDGGTGEGGRKDDVSEMRSDGAQVHRGDSRIRKVKVGRNLADSARFRQFYQLTAPDFSVWPISDISSKPLFFYQNELREPPTFQTHLKSYLGLDWSSDRKCPRNM